MCYAKRKKSDSKSHTLYDAIYMTVWKRQNYRNWGKKKSHWLLGVEVEQGFDYEEAAWGNLGSDGTFYLDCNGVYMTAYYRMSEFYCM